MRQMACNATLEGMGHLNDCRYVLHDRDAKFCPEFRETLAAAGVKCLRLPPRSPNLNAFAERWVRSVKEECLSHLILCGERSLRKALLQFQEHYHEETQPPRQEQRAALPRPCSARARSATWHPLSRMPWRLTPVLQPRRMNILTIRELVGNTRTGSLRDTQLGKRRTRLDLPP